MHASPRARLVAYSVAVLAPAVALLVRWPLWPVLGDAVPHMTVFPAVMIAAYFGGFWPGLLATFLSTVAANYFLTGQLRCFHVTSVNDVAILVLFGPTGRTRSWPTTCARPTASRPAGLQWAASAASWASACTAPATATCAATQTRHRL
jgi:hypothetical protein